MNDTEIKAVIKDLAEQVKSLRLQRKWTQIQLMEKSGVTRRTLQRFEAGENMSVDTLLKIISVFGRTIKI